MVKDLDNNEKIFINGEEISANDYRLTSIMNLLNSLKFHNYDIALANYYKDRENKKKTKQTFTEKMQARKNSKEIKKLYKIISDVESYIESMILLTKLKNAYGITNEFKNYLDELANHMSSNDCLEKLRQHLTKMCNEYFWVPSSIIKSPINNVNETFIDVFLYDSLGLDISNSSYIVNSLCEFINAHIYFESNEKISLQVDDLYGLYEARESYLKYSRIDTFLNNYELDDKTIDELNFFKAEYHYLIEISTEITLIDQLVDNNKTVSVELINVLKKYSIIRKEQLKNKFNSLEVKFQKFINSLGQETKNNYMEMLSFYDNPDLKKELNELNQDILELNKKLQEELSTADRLEILGMISSKRNRMINILLKYPELNKSEFNIDIEKEVENTKERIAQVDNSENKLRNDCYQDYIQEIENGTFDSKKSFSDYLIKRYHDSIEMKDIIKKELSREALAYHLYAKYLEYYKGLENKKNVISFQEFINYIDVNVPVERKEQYEVLTNDKSSGRIK